MIQKFGILKSLVTLLSVLYIKNKLLNLYTKNNTFNKSEFVNKYHDMIFIFQFNLIYYFFRIFCYTVSQTYMLRSFP